MSKKMSETLSELQLKGDVFTRQMVVEKKRLMDLEEAIIEADRQIVLNQKAVQQDALDVLNLHTKHPKKTADGHMPSKQGEDAQAKQVMILENRLNKLLVRLSQTTEGNFRIRHEIDQQRRKRIVQDESRDKLEDRLRETQERINTILENSQRLKEAHQTIIEAQHKLMQDNQDEETSFEEEYARLGDYVDQKTMVFEQAFKEAANEISNQLETFSDTRGELNVSQELQIQTQLKDYAALAAREHVVSQETDEKIAAYIEGFSKLTSAAKRSAKSAGLPSSAVAKLHDVEEVKKLFSRNQEETFSIFKYIQDQIEETDAIQERTARIQIEHTKYETDMGEEEAARAESVKAIEDSIRQTEEQTAEYTHSAAEAQRTVDKLAKKVQSLFYKIQCDQVDSGGKGTKRKAARPMARTDSQLLLAGGGGGVNESNILQFMELIEQRAVEIIADFTRKAAQRDQQLMTPVLSSGASVYSAEQVLNKVRGDSTAEDEEGEAEADDRPITLNEMRRQTAEKLMKSKTGDQPPSGGGGSGGGGGGGARSSVAGVTRQLNKAESRQSRPNPRGSMTRRG